MKEALALMLAAHGDLLDRLKGWRGVIAGTVVVFLAGACGPGPTSVPDDKRIDWPVREWRDTVVVWDPAGGENLPAPEVP